MLQNKKILFIIDKSYLKNKIEETSVFKDLKIQNEINFHYAHSIVPFYSYKYPNNIKYKELPYIGDLSYKLNIKTKEDNTTPFALSYQNLSKDFFLSYDTIIFAVNPDTNGCYGAYLELQEVFGDGFENHFENIYNLNTYSVMNDFLSNELEKILTNKKYKEEQLNYFYKLVKQGKIKRHFDYNYQINCNVFVKEVYKELFFNDYKDNQEFEDSYTKFGFTKYMLLTMFAFYSKVQNAIFSLEELLKFMTRYIGTGKYKNKYEYEYIQIGSITSQGQIIENLISLKIINKENIGYAFNSKLENFIKLLNKKVYDPDLPYRIENWCELEFEDAKFKINNYIQEIFVKQKIKNKFLSSKQK